jgi:photosystem II stability/assembly factor-like uncharacterized protein
MKLTRIGTFCAPVVVVASAGILLFVLAGCGGGGGSCRVLKTDSRACVSHPGLFAIYDLVIDPQHPQTVYAASNDAVVKSTDGGSSWKRVDPWGDQGVDGVVLDPRRPDTVYVGTQDGIYMSTDGGSSWTHSLNRPNMDPSIGIAPRGRVLYAAGVCTPSTTYPEPCFYSGPHLFKSTDGGASWKPFHGRPPTWFFSVFDPYHTQTVYADTKSGVVKSTDGGKVWHHLRIPGGAGASDLAFSLHATYADDGQDVFEKTNAGKAWRLLAQGNLHSYGQGDFLAIAVSANGRVLYAGTDSGEVYRFRASADTTYTHSASAHKAEHTCCLA